MSTYADPSKAMLWLDGDAFRAPAGTAVPADIFAATLVGWEAFGGIQAGYVVDRPRAVEELEIWNADGTYRLKKDQEKPLITIRPVDMSKATALTLLTGGSVVATNGGFRWDEGEEEQFALIVRALDGTTTKHAHYVEKGELSNRPSGTYNDQQLMGWDMEIKPLVPDSGGKPIIPFTLTNPLA
jgi:hypothetical protein